MEPTVKNQQTSPHALDLHARATDCTLQALQRDLTAATRVASLFVARDRLAAELRRLDRLHRCAHAAPQRFARMIAGQQKALSLWLYGVAVGVAAQGLPDTALALLDLLPGVAAGAQGRRELLLDLLGDSEASPLLLAA